MDIPARDAERLLQAAEIYCRWPTGKPLRLQGLGNELCTATLLGGVEFDMGGIFVACECGSCATKPALVENNAMEEKSRIMSVLEFAIHCGVVDLVEQRLYGSENELYDDEAAVQAAASRMLTDLLFVLEVPRDCTAGNEEYIEDMGVRRGGRRSRIGGAPALPVCEDHVMNSCLSQKESAGAADTAAADVAAAGALAAQGGAGVSVGPLAGVPGDGGCGRRGGWDGGLFTGRLVGYDAETGAHRIRFDPGLPLELWRGNEGEEEEEGEKEGEPEGGSGGAQGKHEGETAVEGWIHVAVCHVVLDPDSQDSKRTADVGADESSAARTTPRAIAALDRRGFRGPFRGCVEVAPSHWDPTRLDPLLRRHLLKTTASPDAAAATAGTPPQQLPPEAPVSDFPAATAAAAGATAAALVGGAVESAAAAAAAARGDGREADLGCGVSDAVAVTAEMEALTVTEVGVEAAGASVLASAPAYVNPSATMVIKGHTETRADAHDSGGDGGSAALGAASMQTPCPTEAGSSIATATATAAMTPAGAAAAGSPVEAMEADAGRTAEEEQIDADVEVCEAMDMDVAAAGNAVADGAGVSRQLVALEQQHHHEDEHQQGQKGTACGSGIQRLVGGGSVGDGSGGGGGGGPPEAAATTELGAAAGSAPTARAEVPRPTAAVATPAAETGAAPMPLEAGPAGGQAPRHPTRVTEASGRDVVTVTEAVEAADAGTGPIQAATDAVAADEGDVLTEMELYSLLGQQRQTQQHDGGKDTEGVAAPASYPEAAAAAAAEEEKEALALCAAIVELDTVALRLRLMPAARAKLLLSVWTMTSWQVRYVAEVLVAREQGGRCQRRG
ncbi:hypothetical protein VOLCADRAFT_99726 [Volvox carteri f. nagariensis]|uniref:Uncharacterized protein n=1 Tax=Volvox carteri f. nagariensis TaxID=3068 RepID=D8UIH4_VOLCA|nr:uncharacterized protein VOLCADRAFT_99726 [Volvox carteri f. nagariensis]EFJ40453.1 hypothetical protein VOLCADRAFT_99726 [Volvox carteri f. nagariensis]|eukprot:XP_002958453.1 hypothetical protein VOLCADRAFT_99726 [Volvox carteri f. nagariensis]